jgi:hypothetical protein
MNHVRLVVMLAVACKSGSEAPPKPFAGPLTVDRIMQKVDVPLCADPWDRALAKIEAKLGPVTKADGDKFIWAVSEGDTCAMVRFDRGECPPSWNKPGQRLAMAVDPDKTTPTSTTGNHAACVAAAKH